MSVRWGIGEYLNKKITKIAKKTGRNPRLFRMMHVFDLTVCIACININNTKRRINVSNNKRKKQGRGEKVMVLAIDDSSDIPIYLQLRNQIVLAISDGRLAPGEQLPTVRGLAEEIGVNAMTVNRAYQVLKQDGYIVTDRRNGARVCTQFAGNEGLSVEAEETLRRIISEAKIAGMTEQEFYGVCSKYF